MLTEGASRTAGAIGKAGRAGTAAVGGVLVDISRQGTAVGRAVVDELRQVRLGLTLLSRDAAAKVTQLRTGIQVPATQLLRLSRDLAGKGLRIASSGSVILSAGALFFQGWSFKSAWDSLDTTLGDKAAESWLAILSPTVGVVGLGGELYGNALKALGMEAGGKWVVRGGVIAALASAVDAVQSALSAKRTFNERDFDAFAFHVGASVAFFSGAVVGGYAAVTSATALMGPLGWALLLIAAGVLLTWAALNAEDTEAEIWLNRCYFGKGTRTEGPWTDRQFETELMELNAIIAGLSVRLGFAGLVNAGAAVVTGFRRVEAEIKLAGYRVERAHYAWALEFYHQQHQNYVLFDSGEYPQQPRRQPLEMRAVEPGATLEPYDAMFRDDKLTVEYKDGVRIMRLSCEVNRAKFQRARLTVNYWPDREDSSAVAQRHIEVDD